MIVRLNDAYNSAFNAVFFTGHRQENSDQAANHADTVSISDTARRLQAEESAELVPTPDPIDARLVVIQATPPSERTAEDIQYQQNHDAKLAAILKKYTEHTGSLTSAELHYWQKASAHVQA